MSAAPPRFPFVHVDVDAEIADEAGALFFELGAEGVEERDASTLLRAAAEGKVTLVAAFPDRAAAEAALAELDPAWNGRIEEVVGDAWLDAWKEHFRPFALTPRIVVRPPWEPYAAKPGETVLELEPGRAFGTGLHATTSLVARELDARSEELAGRDLLDVGTGSGILAVVALALGAGTVRGIDVDEDAVAVARENAARNGMSARARFDATPVDAVMGTFPVVLANIEARVLVPLAPAIAARVAPGGLLVLSGILVGQEDDVAAAYPGFRREATRAEGEWIALALRRG
jgi:ribosomal protein L11 methyltransferase